MQAITEERKVPLQVIEAKYLAGPRHAFHACNLAVTAHREKRGRASRIEIEILLYLTGKRQIGDAISLAGVKKETKDIAEYKTRLFHKLTDALETCELDLVILNTAPTSITGRILLNKLVLVDKIPYRRHFYESLTLRKFFDFKVKEDAFFKRRYRVG